MRICARTHRRRIKVNNYELTQLTSDDKDLRTFIADRVLGSYRAS